MPQNRRKVAFSGKKKKEQIQAHRARKRGHIEEGDDYNTHTTECGEATLASAQQDMSVNYHEEVLALNQQPGANTRVNRYNLKFRKENATQKEKRKALHHKPLSLLPEVELETNSEYFYPAGLSYPSRPSWKKNMSKCELDMSENRHFRLFCERIDREFGGRDLSMYELNLETWRQLWRVTEMSDILLIIVDARFPVAQFPPYVYEHLVKRENKGVVLILNKCDLLPPSVILAWQYYFSHKYPKLLVVPFSSVEGCKSQRSLLKMSAESALCLVDACQSLVEDAGIVNLKSWRNKIEEERDVENENQSCEVTETKVVGAASSVPEIYQRFRDGVLTIGTIGHPNVGKSSLINALMGKKVVSVSKTPGHTKHFQTIFLTKDVKLCDCPGLVFPSTVEMPLQVLLGSFPIAQLRDAISVVQYVAARIDIPHIMKLRLEEDWDASEWTSYLICEAWAQKRGYRTRARVADVSRAANELLRLCLNGQKSLILFMRPPGYINDKEKLESDANIEKIKLIQGFHATHIEDNIQGEKKKEEEIFEDNLEFVSEEEEEEEVGSDEEEVLHEEETEEEKEERESEDDLSPVTSTQNKFALLLDDD